MEQANSPEQVCPKRRHQVKVLDKISELPHDLFARWRLFQHGIGDTGVMLNERIDPHPRVHQALKPISDPTPFDTHGADLYRAITHIR
jgi:hypothetical protein